MEQQYGEKVEGPAWARQTVLKTVASKGVEGSTPSPSV